MRDERKEVEEKGLIIILGSQDFDQHCTKELPMKTIIYVLCESLVKLAKMETELAIFCK